MVTSNVTSVVPPVPYDALSSYIGLVSVSSHVRNASMEHASMDGIANCEEHLLYPFHHSLMQGERSTVCFIRNAGTRGKPLTLKQ